MTDNVEVVAQAMLEYTKCHMARLHSTEGTIEYWREMAAVALFAIALQSIHEAK